MLGFFFAVVDRCVMGSCWNLLVGTDTGGFEGFGRQLFVFVGDHVDAEREFIDVGTLAAQIEDANFGIGDTTVEAGLGIWLQEGLKISSAFV